MWRKFTNYSLAGGCGLVLVSLAASVLSFSPSGGSAPAVSESPRYYAVFFSHESESNASRDSHTFATFVKTSGDGEELHVVESATISWLPASDTVSIGRASEKGVNKTLEQTVAWAESHGYQIMVDGPFEIRPELYDRAVQQAAKLNRGELKYRAFDRFTRDTAKNCFHAVADIVEQPKRLQTGTAWGREATLMVVDHLKPYFVANPTAGGDLLAELGAAKFAARPAEQIAQR